uniref:Uncharacterized protein n=1 Tax=Siphoviridae sp. ct4fm14 TaxID=2825331 RepID=A0A8S5UT26_9CAUD|nr:MAG TPA: hypothetical protein [Siphoviridae sp. ct4fm14]
MIVRGREDGAGFLTAVSPSTAGPSFPPASHTASPRRLPFPAPPSRPRTDIGG